MIVLQAKLGIVALVIAAAIAIMTAIAHLSCLFLGPACYSIQMAPEQVVESAKMGTLLAPLGTVFVAFIFISFGLYALSAAKLFYPLPKVKLIVHLIGFACVIRGILPIQLWLRKPEKITEPVLYVGIVWLVVGIFYLLGHCLMAKSQARTKSL